ncbi:MAG TPA: beta-propeller fold lactonase family protein [Burkholderiales bacterium]|nr:beta-propeller fold lactonase family protein [Burkholderiales bacterium]
MDVLYSAVDDEITHYEVDVDNATLARRSSVKVPSFVQYAWPHPSHKHLYVTTSNRGPGLKADFNHVSAWRINAASGALTPHGEPRRLPCRAVHMCVDPAGKYTVNAHNLPKSGITIHRINDDGMLGDEVKQRAELDYGIYPHQVRMAPSGRTTILVDRGNRGKQGKPDDPGALRSYAFDEGMLSKPAVVAPNGGYGFGPRHVDFHPTKPWLYVADESFNRLYLFRMPDDRIESQAAFTCDTLADRANIKPEQVAGTVHVHPNGRYVYVANRNSHTVPFNDRKVSGGGENSIAVYAIDETTGQPTLIQHADAHAFHHIRTFAFDTSARLMIAASIKPMDIREGDKVRTEPAAMTVFRVRPDGRLDYVRKYDVEATGKTQYWMGIVGLP